jgi:hypothetical protein
VDTVLRLLESLTPESFVPSFAPDYPDVPPIITGSQSTGGRGKGKEEAVMNIFV